MSNDDRRLSVSSGSAPFEARRHKHSYERQIHARTRGRRSTLVLMMRWLWACGLVGVLACGARTGLGAPESDAGDVFSAEGASDAGDVFSAEGASDADADPEAAPGSCQWCGGDLNAFVCTAYISCSGDPPPGPPPLGCPQLHEINCTCTASSAECRCSTDGVLHKTLPLSAANCACVPTDAFPRSIIDACDF
jgi:hypothetical protein